MKSLYKISLLCTIGTAIASCSKGSLPEQENKQSATTNNQSVAGDSDKEKLNLKINELEKQINDAKTNEHKVILENLADSMNDAFNLLKLYDKAENDGKILENLKNTSQILITDLSKSKNNEIILQKKLEQEIANSNRLKIQVKDKEQEITKLNEKIAGSATLTNNERIELNNQLNEANTSLQALKKQFTTAKALVLWLNDSAVKENTKKNELIKTLNAKNIELLEKLEQAKTYASEKNIENIVSSVKQASNLLNLIDLAEKEAKKLVDAKANKIELSAQLQTKEKEILRLHTEINNSKTLTGDEKSELNKQLIAANNAKEEINTKLTTANNSIKELTDKQTANDQLIAKLNSDIANKNNDLNKNKEEILALKAQLSSQLETKEKEILRLHTEINNSKTLTDVEKTNLNKQLIAANNAKEEINTKLTTANETIKSLNEKLAKKETPSDDLKNAKEDIKNKTKEIADLKMQIALKSGISCFSNVTSDFKPSFDISEESKKKFCSIIRQRINKINDEGSIVNLAEFHKDFFLPRKTEHCEDSTDVNLFNIELTGNPNDIKLISPFSNDDLKFIRVKKGCLKFAFNSPLETDTNTFNINIVTQDGSIFRYNKIDSYALKSNHVGDINHWDPESRPYFTAVEPGNDPFIPASFSTFVTKFTDEEIKHSIGAFTLPKSAHPSYVYFIGNNGSYYIKDSKNQYKSIGDSEYIGTLFPMFGNDLFSNLNHIQITDDYIALSKDNGSSYYVVKIEDIGVEGKTDFVYLTP